jgi:hypothetical protein
MKGALGPLGTRRASDRSVEIKQKREEACCWIFQYRVQRTQGNVQTIQDHFITLRESRWQNLALDLWWAWRRKWWVDSSTGRKRVRMVVVRRMVLVCTPYIAQAREYLGKMSERYFLSLENNTVTYCTGNANFMYQGPEYVHRQKVENWTSQWHLKINNIWPPKLALIGRDYGPHYPCFFCDHTSVRTR